MAPTSAPSCQPGPDGVELDPEALSVIHAKSTNPNDQTASKLGISGTGVKVAYMAESIDPNNPDNPIGEAIAYAVLAGVAMGVARTVATRQAAAFYKKSDGHLPDAMQDAKDEIDKIY